MADIHTGTWLRPSKVEVLTDWMGTQRWYAAKGSRPSLTPLASWRLGDPAGEVGIETHILLDDSGPEQVTYQVPLTYRGAPLEGAEHALVGTMEHGVLGTRWVYDATHDPVYAIQLLALIQGGVTAESSTHSDTVDARYVGQPAASWSPELTATSATVLSGEQSNTSIIVDAYDAGGRPTPVIIKIFRTLGDGENPDVVLQSALREAGCRRVPAVVGSVAGSWPERAERGEPASATASPEPATQIRGHLAFAQEFIAGSEDAWRVALRAAKQNTDFTEAARALGAATAEVHTALAQALPTQPATAERVEAITSVMRRRLAGAAELVPQIASHAEQIEAVFDAAQAGPWPPLQRIHGDYHLGQVLHAPERGWVVLDFEGEPLRPLAERSQPDCRFRDIAGMLRSFDYAGGSAEHAQPAMDARVWVDNGVTAFLDGYHAADPDVGDYDHLLAAFLLDKALYEVVYEARNRPTWLPIPVAAITRLVGQAQENDDKRGHSA